MDRVLCEHGNLDAYCEVCNEDVKPNETISHQAQIFVSRHKLSVHFVFNVMYSGWDCDDEGLVCRDENGKNVLVMSNHGTFYTTNDVNVLAERIREYERTLRQTRKAVALLSHQDTGV